MNTYPKRAQKIVKSDNIQNSSMGLKIFDRITKIFKYKINVILDFLVTNKKM